MDAPKPPSEPPGSVLKPVAGDPGPGAGGARARPGLAEPLETPAAEGWDPARYEEDLARGLSLAGEDWAYFARSRVEAVAGVCREIGLAPRAILEFGCGTGNNLIFLRRAFPESRLVGLEPSPAMLEAARSRLAGSGIDLIGGSQAPEHLPPRAGGPGETVDLVFVNGVFHHIPPAERADALAAIRGHLAPSGLLALFENNPLNPGAMWVMRRIPFDRDARPVRAAALGRLVRAAGFGDPWVRSYFYFPRPLRFLRPLEPALSRLPLGAQYALYARTAPPTP